MKQIIDNFLISSFGSASFTVKMNDQIVISFNWSDIFMYIVIPIVCIIFACLGIIIARKVINYFVNRVGGNL